MILNVNHDGADASARIAGIRLALLTLRCIENWRRHVDDWESAAILLAVVAITGERLTRADLDPALRRLGTPVPAGSLGRANISSIASATGLNRETARRRVNDLVASGRLERGADGSIRLDEAFLAGPAITGLVRAQLENLVRTANGLLRDGVIELA